MYQSEGSGGLAVDQHSQNGVKVVNQCLSMRQGASTSRCLMSHVANFSSGSSGRKCTLTTENGCLCDLPCNVRAWVSFAADSVKSGCDLGWPGGLRPHVKYREHLSGSVARTLQDK